MGPHDNIFVVEPWVVTQHKPRRVECGSGARCGFNAGRAGGLEAGRRAMWVGLDAGWGRVDGRCGSGPHPSGSASTPHFFRCGFNAGRAGGLEVGRRRMWVGTTSKWICLHATFFSMWLQCGSGRWVGGGSAADVGRDHIQVDLPSRHIFFDVGSMRVGQVGWRRVDRRCGVCSMRVGGGSTADVGRDHIQVDLPPRHIFFDLPQMRVGQVGWR